MNTKNALFPNKILFTRIMISLLMFPTIGITICYSQNSNDILEDKSNIFKIDYRLNAKSAPYAEFVGVLAKDNVAYKEWKKGRTLKAIGNIITVPSIVFTGLGIASLNSKDDIASGLAPIMLGGLGGSIIGIALIITGNNKKLNAIEMFNKKNKVYLGLLNNGTHFGMVINLNKIKS